MSIIPLDIPSATRSCTCGLQLKRMANRSNRKTNSSSKNRENQVNQELKELRQAIRELASIRKEQVPRPVRRLAAKASQKMGIPSAAHALAMTFVSGNHVQAHTSTIPVMPPIPTQKVTVKGDFDGVANANGVIQMFIIPTIASDSDCFQISGASFTGGGGGFIRSAAATAGMTGIACPFPYTRAALQVPIGLGSSTSNLWRVVSVHVEAEYSGAFTNMAGGCFSITTHRNDDISSYSLANIVANPETARTTFSSSPRSEISCYPKQRQQMELTNVTYYPLQAPDTAVPYFDYTQNGVTSGESPAGMLFRGMIAGTTVHFKYTVNVEYAGSTIGMLATPNSADESCLEQALNLATLARQSHVSEPTAPVHHHLAGHAGYSVADKVFTAAERSGNPYLAAGAEMGQTALKLYRSPVGQALFKGLASYARRK